MAESSMSVRNDNSYMETANGGSPSGGRNKAGSIKPHMRSVFVDVREHGAKNHEVQR